MKLIAGAALVSCLFFAGGERQSPDLFFQEGATFVYKGQAVFEDGKDSRYTSTMRIDKVTEKGSHRSSVAGLGYSHHGEIPTEAVICRFACDSANFYCNTTNFIGRSVKEREEAEANDSGDSLMYPFSMKVGDTLPGAWYKTSLVSRAVNLTNEVHFVKRRVESLDTLNLGVGKITAYRITMTEVSNQKASSPYTGNESSSTQRQRTEWFSPFYGIVRMQYNRENGVDIIELVSCKSN